MHNNRLENEYQHNNNWMQRAVVQSQPQSNYLCFSMVAVESQSLDLWLLPIATLRRYWFSISFKESVSVINVPASDSLLLLRTLFAHNSKKSSLCLLTCVSRLVSDGRLRLRRQHCATEAADSGCSLIHRCSGQPSQGRRLWMWRWVRPKALNNQSTTSLHSVRWD